MLAVADGYVQNPIPNILWQINQTLFSELLAALSLSPFYIDGFGFILRANPAIICLQRVIRIRRIVRIDFENKYKPKNVLNMFKYASITSKYVIIINI